MMQKQLKIALYNIAVSYLLVLLMLKNIREIHPRPAHYAN